MSEVTENSTEIMVIDPKQFGLEESKADEIKVGLTPILEERNVLAEKYKEVLTMDIDDPNTSKIASELRKRIKENRTGGIEKWHKANKEFYLRGGQFVDAIKKKEIVENERMEENLSKIENHFAIKLKEQQDKLHLERLEQIKPYVEDTTALDFRTMEQDVFDAYLTAKKNAYDAKIKAEQEEQEKIAREKVVKEAYDKRKEILVPLWNHLTEEDRDKNFGELTEEAFELIKSSAESVKKDKEDADRIQREENDRLKKQAEAKEKLIAERSELMMPYVTFIRDFNAMLNLDEKEFKKQLAEVKKGAELQWEEERVEQLRKQKESDDLAKKQAKEKADAEAKLKKEQEEKAKLEKELDDKKQAEEKAIKEKADAEEKAIKEAEALAKAPIKKQLLAWLEEYKQVDVPMAIKKDTKEEVVARQILTKFNGFKDWAKQEIEKL